MTVSDDLRAAKALTKTQIRVLQSAPDTFGKFNPSVVIGGPSPWRTVDALLDAGMIRVRSPEGTATLAGFEWRITDAGRRAIAAAEETDNG